MGKKIPEIYWDTKANSEVLKTFLAMEIKLETRDYVPTFGYSILCLHMAPHYNCVISF